MPTGKYIRSLETRRRISEGHKGKTLSEKTKEKIRQTKLSKIYPEQTPDGTKICLGCKEIKLISCFYVRENSRPSSRCKECLYAQSKDRWARNKEKYNRTRLAWDTKQRKDPVEKLKIAARTKLRIALLSNQIFKKKCFCGSELVHAHHKDYSRPLDITWLCPKHHSQAHKTNV